MMVKHIFMLIINIYFFSLQFQAPIETVKDLRAASLFALTETSILKRTSNCQNYFDNFGKTLKPRLPMDLGENLDENLAKLNSKSEESR